MAYCSKWIFTQKCLDMILAGKNPFADGFVCGAIMVKFECGRMKFYLQNEDRDVLATMELDYFPGNMVHLEGLEVRGTVEFANNLSRERSIMHMPCRLTDSFDEWNW